MRESEYLTKNFQLKELLVTRAYPYLQDELYLTITPYMDSLFLLCYLLLQPVRDQFNVPVHVLSGYRSPELNAKVGGSYDSRHMIGKAADFTVDNRALLTDIFKWLKYTKEDTLGELILYKHADRTNNFIHVALPRWSTATKINEVTK